MSDHNSPTVLLSVDIKKYRIRIHKATLHLLGDPPYIQLLINPSSSIVNQINAPLTLAISIKHDSVTKCIGSKLLSEMAFLNKI